MNRPIRVGINGFGRIGRTTARQLLANPEFTLVAVNDIAEDIHNLTYLYNYDSTYRQPPVKAEVRGDGVVGIGKHEVCFSSAHNILDVPWEKLGVDVLVDSSGVKANAINARQLTEQGRVHKVVVTNSPDDAGIDCYIVLGVNDNAYDPTRHHVVSSSICDVNAVAHPLKWLDSQFTVEGGFFTTLHPWLSYQNLLDGPMASQSNPGHFWTDFSLGRSGVGMLIPKNTTAATALKPILPKVASRLDAFSYRVPTATVASADLTLRLGKRVSTEELIESLSELCRTSPYVAANYESLVGGDYIQNDHSAIIDFQWIRSQGEMIKIVLWYDNEWGYSARVVDMVRLLGSSCRE